MYSRTVFCIAALAIAAACSQSEPRQQAAGEAVPQAAPVPATPAPQAGATPARYDGPLPPIPAPGFEAPRPPDVMQAVYEFAGRRPDVLRHIPCFCGCERSGHAGNDDCFVKSRDASGKPEWDTHGYG